MTRVGSALPFANRNAAGIVLAARLKQYAGHRGAVVLGLPRGGVPVAWEVARELAIPLDICLVRKVGAPWNPELALGAIASGGAIVWNEGLLEQLSLPEATISAAVGSARAELARREESYRLGLPSLLVRSQITIVVDDGLATGATMRAAALSLRAHDPAWLVLAAPVGSLAACELLEKCADEVICAYRPDPFDAVGDWYEDFTQVEDDEVRRLLRAASLSDR